MVVRVDVRSEVRPPAVQWRAQTGYLRMRYAMGRENVRVGCAQGRRVDRRRQHGLVAISGRMAFAAGTARASSRGPGR